MNSFDEIIPDTSLSENKDINYAAEHTLNTKILMFHSSYKLYKLYYVSFKL